MLPRASKLLVLAALLAAVAVQGQVSYDVDADGDVQEADELEARRARRLAGFKVNIHRRGQLEFAKTLEISADSFNYDYKGQPGVCDYRSLEMTIFVTESKGVQTNDMAIYQEYDVPMLDPVAKTCPEYTRALGYNGCCTFFQNVYDSAPMLGPVFRDGDAIDAELRGAFDAQYLPTEGADAVIDRSKVTFAAQAACEEPREARRVTDSCHFNEPCFVKEFRGFGVFCDKTAAATVTVTHADGPLAGLTQKFGPELSVRTGSDVFGTMQLVKTIVGREPAN